MNGRIKLLAEQAGATVMERSGWTDYGTLNLEVEKFAESIIRECADIALREEHDPYECIKKHFGVK